MLQPYSSQGFGSGKLQIDCHKRLCIALFHWCGNERIKKQQQDQAWDDPVPRPKEYEYGADPQEDDRKIRQQGLHPVAVECFKWIHALVCAKMRFMVCRVLAACTARS